MSRPACTYDIISCDQKNASERTRHYCTAINRVTCSILFTLGLGTLSEAAQQRQPFSTVQYSTTQALTPTIALAVGYRTTHLSDEPLVQEHPRPLVHFWTTTLDVSCLCLSYTHNKYTASTNRVSGRGIERMAKNVVKGKTARPQGMTK